MIFKSISSHMSLKKLIRKGDTTTHGGIVIEGVSGTNIHGKEAACIGHMVYCPKCNGTYPIIEGAEGMPMFDKPVAVEGMHTACGAELIASQSSFVLDVLAKDILSIDDLLAVEPVLVASLGNGVLPGGGKPSWRIIDRNRTIIIMTNVGSKDYLGNHAGLIIEPETKNALLYDPGGSYCAPPRKINGKEVIRSSSDIFYGKEVNVADYVKYQIEDDGEGVVKLHQFQISKEEMNQIVDRIEAQQTCTGGLCARCTTNAVIGIGPFANFKGGRVPKSLREALDKLENELK